MSLYLRSISRYVAVAISIFLVIILFSQISLSDVTETLTKIPLINVVAGFVLYAFSYIFRAWRFRVLLNDEVKITDLFDIECVHNMVNSLLPARTGELSYIYLLKSYTRRSTGEGIATLVVARIFDFIALAILFFIAVLLIKDVPGFFADLLWIAAFFAIILLIIFIVLLHSGRKFAIFAQKTITKIHLEKNRIADYIVRKSFETAESLEKIRVGKNISVLVLSSFLVWGSNFAIVYLLMSGMNFPISFFSVILGGTLILLTSVLPIQGIAGFGTTESIWTLAFVPLGLSVEEAIISGFCYHIIVILYFMILGTYGWLKLRKYIIL
jgi:hypothetical protein